MNAFCPARNCPTPTDGGVLCKDHAADLVLELRQVPWILEQLTYAYSRQVRFSHPGPTGKATEQPLVLNLAAADVASEYAGTVGRWQAHVADRLGLPVRYPDPSAAVAWLADHLGAVVTMVDAGKMLADVTSSNRHALAVINRPPQKWFTGYCSATPAELHTGTSCWCGCHDAPGKPCTVPEGDCWKKWADEPDECPVALYANADDATVECPRCHTKHDVTERRRILLQHADDVLVTAAEAARAIVVLSDYERGESRLVKRIGMWASRSRIAHRGTTLVHGKSRPLYRLGDIRNLLNDEQSITA